MNSITIAGQLGRDAEIRCMPNGDAVCNFSVADSQGKDKPTIWWRCSLFGKRAESLAQYLTKGQAVTVSGNVTEREYQDKDGTQKKAMEIRVHDVALQGGKRDNQDAPRSASEPVKQAAKQAGGSGFEGMDDDIPFISANFLHDMTNRKASRAKVTRHD
jgi:single-strand DNA-binding protein